MEKVTETWFTIKNAIYIENIAPLFCKLQDSQSIPKAILCVAFEMSVGETITEIIYFFIPVKNHLLLSCLLLTIL